MAAVDQEAAEGRGTVTWDALECARGVVRLGGNALDDCDQLYDDP